MRYNVDFMLNSSIKSFRDYIIFHSKVIKNYIDQAQKGYGIYSIETYIIYLKIAKLDGFFHDVLSQEDSSALNDWTRNKLESYELPPMVNKAYEIWKETFFGKVLDYVFEDLNPYWVGIVLQAIREKNGMTKSDLARAIGVNRKTVILIETGKRLPSLQYIYKASKIFETSIDEIIYLSTI